MPSFAERYIEGITSGIDIKRAQQQRELMDLKMLLAKEQIADIKASRKQTQNLMSTIGEIDPELWKHTLLTKAGVPEEETPYMKAQKAEEERQAKLGKFARREMIAPESMVLADILKDIRPRLEPGVEKGIYAEHIEKGGMIPESLEPYLKPVTEKAVTPSASERQLAEARTILEDPEAYPEYDVTWARRKLYGAEKETDWNTEYTKWYNSVGFRYGRGKSVSELQQQFIDEMIFDPEEKQRVAEEWGLTTTLGPSPAKGEISEDQLFEMQRRILEKLESLEGK